MQNKALADYSYDTSSEIQVTETTDSSFELTYSEDELTCAAGGGSTPSMWVGTMTGNGNTNANDYDGTDKADDFLTAGLGFNGTISPGTTNAAYEYDGTSWGSPTTTAVSYTHLTLPTIYSV